MQRQKTRFLEKRHPLRRRCYTLFINMDTSTTTRLVVYGLFTAFVFIHFFFYAVLLYKKFNNVKVGYSWNITFLPLVLLCAYPLIIIPIVGVVLFLDLARSVGPCVWHRNSLGILFQRLVYSIMFMLIFIILGKCIEEVFENPLNPRFQDLYKTCFPLLFLCLLLSVKLIFLKTEDLWIHLWFIILSFSQFMFLLFTYNMSITTHTGHGQEE
mmetsp:Transcript_31526/g.30852  ORF Transcript_31526/g.30852 Transcript_31526/m.30852 type:complete len:212 (+) Transcript_31526:2-637(+)